jgi:hypothetical protein
VVVVDESLRTVLDLCPRPTNTHARALKPPRPIVSVKDAKELRTASLPCIDCIIPLDL